MNAHINGHCRILSPDSKVTCRSHHLEQHNKQHHRKVLLNSFHLNGHNLGFHPQTQKVVQHDKQQHRKVLLSSIICHTIQGCIHRLKSYNGTTFTV